MIDINRAKQRMQEIQNSSKSWNKLSYSLKQGENKIRFVTPPGESWPFLYGSMYYKLAKQWFISPTMYDEEDPIMDNLLKLKNSGKQEDAVFAKKLFPSNRVFALVLPRQLEEPKLLWMDFPAKIEKQLVTYILNEDYGDITDTKNGTDFIITKTKGKNGFPEYTVQPKRNASPLMDTKKEIDELLENIPDFKQAYKHYTKQQLEEIWEKYLNDSGEDEEVEEVKEEIADEEEKIDISQALARFKNKKLNN